MWKIPNTPPSQTHEMIDKEILKSTKFATKTVFRKICHQKLKIYKKREKNPVE
jgi:hypothetical protein